MFTCCPCLSLYGTGPAGGSTGRSCSGLSMVATLRRKVNRRVPLTASTPTRTIATAPATIRPPRRGRGGGGGGPGGPPEPYRSYGERPSHRGGGAIGPDSTESRRKPTVRGGRLAGLGPSPAQLACPIQRSA